MTQAQVKSLRFVAGAIVDIVKETGSSGAHDWQLYSAMKHTGRTPSQFNSIMDALVDVGQLYRSGDLYFAEARHD